MSQPNTRQPASVPTARPAAVLPVGTPRGPFGVQPGDPDLRLRPAELDRLLQQLGKEAEPELALLGPLESVRFLARAKRTLRDSWGSIAALYGAENADALSIAFACVAAKATAGRSLGLRELDAEREVDPHWFQQPTQLGYVAYCERFGPTVADVEARVPYLSDLGVTYFHLMKVLEPRPEPNDGGFAVADYRNVDPNLGTLEDLKSLAAALRGAGISLCVDLVMNHTAREHPWAVAARNGDADKRAYYITYPDRTEPDIWEQSLPEVFPEIAPGNFTFSDEMNAWVWTTFNNYQWDLNYANPEVFSEMLETILFLANVGIDVLRLDAVAFTWKRAGTNCQNQPEAHLIAQVLRSFTELAAPGVLLKAEAIVGPRELTGYLGAHGAHGERAECQLAYHNQLMVMIWSALASRDAILLSTAMRRLSPTPSGAAWATYVRCHDDIGWAVDDADAAAAGINGAMHRSFLASFYRGDFPGSFAEGTSFSVNEETGDERTCGSTASLAGLSQAIRNVDVEGVALAVKRITLAYGLAASFGMPLVYMGDEVGLCNDLTYLKVAAHADDSRWMQRPRMDWDAVARSNDPETIEYQIRTALLHLFETRAATRALTQGGDTWIVDAGDPRVFAFGRYHPREGRLLGVANMSEVELDLSPEMFAGVGLSTTATDVLHTPGVGVWDGRLHLPALTLAWFTDGLGDQVVPPLPA
jgi:amylosucrase